MGGPTRRSTGDAALDDDLSALLDDVGVTDERGVLTELMVSALRLAQGDHERLDLKITAAAVEEMRQAFVLFAPYRSVPKVTIFGSARTRPDDHPYVLTKQFAAAMAAEGWMVVTGAGPGIMAAGAEGAGPELSLGVNIRLPFEQAANQFVDDASRLVTMKYFFTRKLMLVKEAQAFVSMPGGFGTLDETFELLTLQQTGKAEPVPIVLLDVPGGSYWAGWERFVFDEVEAGGMVSPEDRCLWRRTTRVEEASQEILRFWSNHHSLRYVGDRLVLRMRNAVSDERLAAMNETLGDLATDGRIVRTDPLRPEVDDDDHVDLPRLMLRFTPRHYARRRRLIDAVNEP